MTSSWKAWIGVAQLLRRVLRRDMGESREEIERVIVLAGFERQVQKRRPELRQ